jgi:radical SAM protein with 4Fe4S-binding SPASM domain
MEDFKTIFDQLSPHIFHQAMYNWGEPFLNKRIFDMIAYANENGVGTTVHSNLNHFSEGMAENCVKSGLTHVYLSIDGASQPVYEIYRKKGNLDRVLANLELLLAARKRHQSKFPFITWKFLQFNHNVQEEERARAMAERIGVDNFEVFRASENLMDIRDEANGYLKEPKKLNALPPQCASLWSSIYISPDGSVLPCSLAFRASEVFGNLLQNKIGEVWNGDKYRMARQFFTSPESAPAPPSPCNGCKYFLKCAFATGRYPELN